MTVYIRTQDGNELIEKGAYLGIGGTKRNSIITGENRMNTQLLGMYTQDTVWEVFGYIVNRIINPTAQEIKKGIIYIDLNEMEKFIDK